MKRKTFSLRHIVCAAVCAMGFTLSAMAQVNPKPFVVPELTSWTGAEGQFVPSGRVVYTGGKDAEAAARLFANDYAALTGKSLTVAKGKAAKGDFAIVLKKDKSLGKEGYSLNIADVTTITAANTQALIWGTRTALQLTDQADKTTRALPKGSTKDIPQYALRGFMIDCGRKFIPMNYLRNLVKMMSYYKMNTLQVHLNDNGFRQFFGNDWAKTQAAFRLESDTYPGLAAKDGHYTKSEFIELQKLAETYGVEIIPEIDAPAHTLAFTHYRPELGSEKYGMDHLDIFKPETYEFLDGLYKEYLEGKEPVFRGKRVHIGTDEFSNATKELVEQFRHFANHYINYVEKYGKQAVLWGSLTHAKGDTPVKSENVLMSCWYNGFAQPKDMKEQGYQLISIPDGYVYIVPAAGYYYDYLNCQWLYDSWTPANIGGVQFEEQDPSIEGGMFAVWNDHAGNGISVKDIHDRVFPALQTLAVKCWSGKKTSLPYGEFDTRRKTLVEAPGVNEAGRLEAPVQVAEVKPGQTLDVEEVGYDYTVSFTIDAKAEAKGTVLFASENATFYLSDPRTGRLGFARDGYLNTFNYSLPADQSVKVTIQGNNKMTRLLINDKVKEELGPQTIYALREQDHTNYQYGVEGAWQPEMYNPQVRMYYQRTLVFPLRKAGEFKSRVTNLSVKNGID